MIALSTPVQSQNALTHPYSTRRHFVIHSEMGFTTPPAPSSLLPQSYEDLVTARRKLDFTIRDVGDIIYPSALPSNTIVKHKDTPPPQVSEYYEKILLRALSDYLIVRLSRFYFSLHWDGDVREEMNNHTAIWKVVVLVSPSLVSVAEQIIQIFEHDYSPEIPIRVGKGQYEWVSSNHRGRQEFPAPGASIAIDGDHGSSVSLGGYVVGDKSKRVYAMTVGHMCFDAPQPLNHPPPSIHALNQLMQPSIQDFDGQLKVLEEDYKWMVENEEMEIAEKIKDMQKDWWKYRARNAFAEPTFATWTTVGNDPDDIPVVQDISLWAVYKERCGTNAFSLQPPRGYTDRVRGIAPVTENLAIYKVGRSTGYTEGSITSIRKCFFWDRTQQYRIISLYFEPPVGGPHSQCNEMGDSGSWIINAAGKVVGMINAAVVEADPPNPNRPLGNACFTPISDCLAVCEKYLGESFSVLT